MKKIVVITGAGMSAESGLKTFRDHDGLWENYRVEEVATPEAWEANPELVNRFYNERRKELYKSSPNKGHQLVAELEKYFDVQVITQNIDDLHEQAGSSKVCHLHGELKKVRSSIDPTLIYDLEGWELKLGDKCEKGSLLRPHIVWFGEAVPEIDRAIMMMGEAEIVIIIGTSLAVYPAASLVHYAASNASIFLIDPKEPKINLSGITHIAKGAGEGMEDLMKKLKTII